MMNCAAITLLLVLFAGCSSVVSADLCGDYEVANCTGDEQMVAFKKAMSNILKAYGKKLKVEDFTCDTSITVDEPTDIHSLSPWYVDVVAAMGDSVTAGYGIGAQCMQTNFFVWQGLSWSIGGDEAGLIGNNPRTLPNILKEFNSNVYGYSEGTVYPQRFNSERRLNRAVGAAQSYNMLCQATDLVDAMAEQDIGDDDWKVVTIWIGSNDLCDPKTCNDDEQTTVDDYIDSVKQALDYLQDHTTRTFVNLVSLMDVSFLDASEHEWTPICLFTHTFFCNCATHVNPDKVQSVQQSINVALHDLADTYDDDNFAVVFQPFFANTDLPLTPEGDPDISYFAPDCFHFSDSGQSIGALYLWNSMLEKVGEKTEAIDWDNLAQLKCPTQDDPYFYTNRNSVTKQ